MTPSVKEASHQKTIFMWNVQNRQIYKDKRYIRVCPWLGVSGDGKGKGKWQLWIWGFFLFLGDENILNLDCADGGPTLWISFKNHWTVHFKSTKDMACELYLHKTFFKIPSQRWFPRAAQCLGGWIRSNQNSSQPLGGSPFLDPLFLFLCQWYSILTNLCFLLSFHPISLGCALPYVH